MPTHDQSTTSAPADASVAAVFATETMAELCVRQGRVAEAVAIYRRLIANPGRDARHARWLARLAHLEAAGRAVAGALENDDGGRPASELRDADLRTMRAIETMAIQLAELELAARSIDRAEAQPPPPAPMADRPVDHAVPAFPGLPGLPVPLPVGHRLALIIEEPVRSGQIVYAEGSDLIVLAPVNPGAQLLADGNIHVYGALRGRAIAGAKGATAARVFCLRLDAELVGIDVAYLMADDIPRTAIGKPSQVFLDAGRCVVRPL
jgi:septum formation inhibitor MinC